MYNYTQIIKERVISIMNKEINVGNIIKNIRIKKGIMLKEVASKCGISSSMLSQIEKGNANPSLNTIREIANTLDVPLFKFFLELEKEDNGIVILKKENRKIITSKNVTYELLSPDVPTAIECMKMILTKKGSESSITPKAHKGEEIAVLLRGKVKITIEDQSCIMEQGDSVHIPSLKPHKWTNIGNEEAVVIFAVTPPEF